MFLKISKTKFLRTLAFISGVSVVKPIVTASSNTSDLYGRFKRR